MSADSFRSPGDVLDLAVLGLASERAQTAAAMIAAIKQLGGARFQPTTDVIAERTVALADAGLRLPSAGSVRGEVLWRPSAAGRAHLERLLMMQTRLPSDALAAVCAGLKICFLGMLEPAARGAVLDDLVAAHRRALRDAQAARAGCACGCAHVQRYLARDVERWEAELCWLEGLQLTATAAVTA